MYAVNDAHRCELCPEPAYHQTWSAIEARWLQFCHEHKDTTDILFSELKRSESDE